MKVCLFVCPTPLFVIVTGPSIDSRKGVYYYDLNDCDFAKYKVYDEAVEKITPGLFISENPFLVCKATSYAPIIDFDEHVFI